MQEVKQTLSFPSLNSYGITLVETIVNPRKGFFGLFNSSTAEPKKAYELKGAIFGKVSEQEINSFYNTWRTLVMNPLSFSYNNKASVEQIILQEESKFHETEILKIILSKELDLPIESNYLKNKIADCNKIFHEDFPGNYILELNGSRLGLFVLSICKNNSGNFNLRYTFKSDVTRFY
ncbi:hypothetical protein [Gramella sp. AN32]|uniref:Uncharacterized protein n=1 Tax=Christiangramia antarctica TaxID=2058158 RepID=A0ABW5X5Y5_9FLAO|nr:hypothetical protein [Gramella sp. AN32]MCM4156117.1 hypothetical protein [Gramella sp. AN32]